MVNRSYIGVGDIVTSNSPMGVLTGMDPKLSACHAGINTGLRLSATF